MAGPVACTLCALALVIQCTLSSCLPFGCGCNTFVPAASSGGNFVVTSSSPAVPVGVSVVSNNVCEGALIVEGNLPLLGCVALEGTMGTAGAGSVSYGCGDCVDIVAEEGPIVTGIVDNGYRGYGQGFYGRFGNLFGYLSSIYGFGRRYGFGYY